MILIVPKLLPPGPTFTGSDTGAASSPTLNDADAFAQCNPSQMSLKRNQTPDNPASNRPTLGARGAFSVAPSSDSCSFPGDITPTGCSTRRQMSQNPSERSDKSIEADIRAHLERCKLNPEQVNHVFAHLDEFHDLVWSEIQRSRGSYPIRSQSTFGSRGAACEHGDLPHLSCTNDPSIAEKLAFEDHAADVLREHGQPEARILGCLRGIGRKGFLSNLKTPDHLLTERCGSCYPSPSEADTEMDDTYPMVKREDSLTWDPQSIAGPQTSFGNHSQTGRKDQEANDIRGKMSLGSDSRMLDNMTD